MATKKTASSAKKRTSAKAGAAQATRVTTVKAVESGSSRKVNPLRGSLLRTPILGASIAEFIGAFLLATTVLIIRNEPFYIFIALIGIFMLVGGLSGAHVNPAVTVGSWVTKRIGWVRAVSYVAAQLLGAMLALVVMNAFIGQAPEVSEADAQFGQSAPELFTAVGLQAGKELSVLFAELIGLVVLGFAYAGILRPVVKEKASAALTVGGAGFVAMALASTVAAYVGSSVALNPAVAVALSAIDFTDIWTLAVYIVAPVLGAVIGFFLYDFIRTSETVVEN